MARPVALGSLGEFSLVALYTARLRGYLSVAGAGVSVYSGRSWRRRSEICTTNFLPLYNTSDVTIDILGAVQWSGKDFEPLTAVLIPRFRLHIRLLSIDFWSCADYEVANFRVSLCQLSNSHNFLSGALASSWHCQEHNQGDMEYSTPEDTPVELVTNISWYCSRPCSSTVALVLHHQPAVKYGLIERSHELDWPRPSPTSQDGHD